MTPRRRILALAALAVACVCAPLVLSPVLHLFLFHPRRDEAADVARVGERVEYRAEDGTLLSSWWVPARGPRRRTIVYFHGNGATASDCAEWAAHLSRGGSDVLLAEYRGYGRSEGSPSARGVELDGDAALRYLREARGVPEREIVVHGQSLGGAVAAHVLAGAGAGVAAGILESTFSSLHDMSRAMFGVALTRLVPDAYALDSLARAPRIRAPILQIHGDADEVIPFALGQALYAALPPGARFVRIRGGTHNLFDPESERAIDAFLREIEGPP